MWVFDTLIEMETGTSCYPLDWAQLVGCMALKQNGTTKVDFETGVFMGTRPSALRKRCFGPGYPSNVKNLTEAGGWKLGLRNVQETRWIGTTMLEQKQAETKKTGAWLGQVFHPTKVPQERVNKKKFIWVIKARFVYPFLVSPRGVHRTRHGYFIHKRYGKKGWKPTGSYDGQTIFPAEKHHPKKMKARMLMLRLKDDRENDEKKNEK